MQGSIKIFPAWKTAAVTAPLLVLVASCGRAEVAESTSDTTPSAPGSPIADPGRESEVTKGPPSSQAEAAGSWTALAGESGSSSQWGSGWLDLPSPRDFAKGARLRLRVGGTAEKILVRLLAKGMSPDSSQGLLGGILTVSANRIVEVPIDIDRKAVIQISVHGGPNPWNKSLGQTNGPATLEAVETLNGG